jgi:transcriptional regulator with AAA-type ATPase domain
VPLTPFFELGEGNPRHPDQLGELTPPRDGFRGIAAMLERVRVAGSAAAHRTTVRIPPLRERGDDILLAERFATAAADKLGRVSVTFSTDAAALMMAYRWPGNVRELRNVVETTVALAESGLIEPTICPTRFGHLRQARIGAMMNSRLLSRGICVRLSAKQFWPRCATAMET